MTVKTIILEIVLTLSLWVIPSNQDAIGELSRRMCKEYTEFEELNECPTTNPIKFPHMVIIGYNDNGIIKWLSSGSLISENFVLTTASSISKNPNRVRLAQFNLNITKNLQEIKIKKAIPHPDFSTVSAHNDIGLLMLEENVTINRYVRPACLFTETEIEVDKAIYCGWNETATNGEGESNLVPVNLDIIGERECNNSYAHRIILSRIITYKTQICAGTKSAEINRPLTGGPLLLPNKDEDGNLTCSYDIIGVASFGPRKLTKENPDVFTRVSAYIPWIEANVWK